MYTLFTTGEEYKGSGGANKVLTLDEEATVVSHVKWRASVGCGITWGQLTSLIQEVLLAVTNSNPDSEMKHSVIKHSIMKDVAMQNSAT